MNCSKTWPAARRPHLNSGTFSRSRSSSTLHWYGPAQRPLLLLARPRPRGRGKVQIARSALNGGAVALDAAAGRVFIAMSLASPARSTEPVLHLGERVELSPEEPVQRDDEAAHGGDPEHDVRPVAVTGRPRNVCTQPGRGEGRASPGYDLSDDAGVPGAAGGSDATGDPGGKDAGDNEIAPEPPPAQALRRCHVTQVGRDAHRSGNGVEEDVPLRPQRHEQNAAEIEADAEPDKY